MEADMLGVVAAFNTALHSAAASFSTDDHGKASSYADASAALERDAVRAVDRLKVALRRLMFTVVLTSLDPKLVTESMCN
jgi:plasmid replication initiation protein